MLNPIRVFVIAETRLYREGLARWLDEEEDLTVVGTAAEESEAVQRLAAATTDLVLLDMAGLGSVEIASVVQAAAPGAMVLALAVPETTGHVVTCAEAGIAGYVPREGSYRDLVAAIGRAARGEAICAPHIVGDLLRRVAALARQRPQAESVPLTRRELEIVSLIDEGKSNKEIASQLSIQLPTVKNHVHHILDKLQVARRSEAAARIRAVRVPR